MKKNRINIFCYCVLIHLSLLTGSQLFAQDTIQKGFEVQEFVKIADVYKSVPNLSYKIRYIYTDSSAPAVILDSQTVSCQVSSGKYFVTDSVTEILYGRRYLVYIDKIDSVINVVKSKPQNILQLPMLDSIFRIAHVQDISSTNINDSTRKLTISFNPDSYYHGYQLTYNSKTFLINQIKYYAINNGTLDLPDSNTICITLDLSGYSPTMIDDSVFNENRYIYMLNGKFYLQPAWQQFQIQNP